MRNYFLRVLVYCFMVCSSMNFLHSQKRCYTYDAAGCRILRDQSCDPTCSTLVVNVNDSGTGSLRKAIECASHGDTIKFAPNVIGQTITLLTSIKINKNIHILQNVNSVVI
jgi:hypothetical protein